MEVLHIPNWICSTSHHVPALPQGLFPASKEKLLKRLPEPSGRAPFNTKEQHLHPKFPSNVPESSPCLLLQGLHPASTGTTLSPQTHPFAHDQKWPKVGVGAWISRTLSRGLHLECYCGMLINVTDWFHSPVPKLSAKFRRILEQQNVLSTYCNLHIVFFWTGFSDSIFYTQQGSRLVFYKHGSQTFVESLQKQRMGCCFWIVFQLVYFPLIPVYRTRLVLETPPVCWAAVKVTAFL